MVAGVKQLPCTDPGRAKNIVEYGYHWFENKLLRIIIPKKAEIRGDEIVVPLSARVEGGIPVYIHANYIEYVINRICYVENCTQKCIDVNKSPTYTISEKYSWLLANHSPQDQYIYWPHSCKGIASYAFPET